MALRDLLARFRIDVQDKALKNADQQINKTKASTQGLFEALGGLKTAFAAVGAAIGFGTFASFVDETIAGAQEIDRMSRSLGLSTERLQQWQAVAARTGVPVDDIRDGFQDLAVRINEAATGTGEGAEVFRELNIEAKNLDGSLRPTEDVMFELADGLANLEDATKRTALADDLLSDAGFRLIPVLEQGSEALRKQLKEAEGISEIYDKEFIVAALKVNVAFKRFGRSLDFVRARIIKFFLPAITTFTAAFTKVVHSINKVVDETNILKATFITLAGAGIAAVGKRLAALIARFGGLRKSIKVLMPVIRPILSALARFFIIQLLIEDLITLFQGGESVIGRFIDAIFGAGTAKRVVEDLKAAWAEYGDTFKAIVREGLRLVGNIISSLLNLFGMFTTDSEEAAAVFEANFLRASQQIGDAIDDIIAAAGFLWEDIKEGAASLVEPIGEFFSQIADSIVGAFDSAIASVTGLIDGVLGRFGRVGDLAKDLATDTLSTLKDLPSRLGGIVSGNAPGGGDRNVTLNDRRQVSVNFNGGNVDGPTARRAGREVNAVLGRDRRATLAAVGG